MQNHIRPFKISDAHLGPWLDWATQCYSLGDARRWVDEGRVLWANQSAYRRIITNDKSRRILGNVEIG